MGELLPVPPACMATPNARACLAAVISLTGIIRTLSYHIRYHFHPCFFDSFSLGVGKERERVFMLFDGSIK